MADLSEEEKKEIIIKYASGSYDRLSIIFPLLEDESLIEDSKRLARGRDVDANETRRIVREVNKTLARQVSPEDLKVMLSMEGLNHGFIKEILEAAKENPGKFSIEMISKLIEQVSTRFNDNTLEFFVDQALLDSHKDSPEGQLIEALEYSDSEKQALSIYTGSAINKRDPLAQDKYVYEVMNMIMFPGLSNEQARIHEDGKVIPGKFMLYTKDLLEAMTDIYAAICKYSKTVVNPIHFKRMDRVATLDAIEDNNQIYSFLSCTLNNEYGDFSKLHTALIEGDAYPGESGGQGPLVLDVGRALGKDYFFETERELMVAPMLGDTFTIENVDSTMTEKEAEIGERKDYLRIDPGQKPRDLTPEEREDEAKAVSFISDVNNTVLAVGFLNDIQIVSQRRQGMSFEDVLGDMVPEKREAYLKWKENFQKAFKYRAMKKALVIDRLAQRGRQNYNEGRVENQEEMLSRIYQELGLGDDLGPMPENHPEEARRAHEFTSPEVVGLNVDQILEQFNISKEQFNKLAKTITVADIKDSIELFSAVVMKKDVEEKQM